jgi:hypothetical protein
VDTDATDSKMAIARARGVLKAALAELK